MNNRTKLLLQEKIEGAKTILGRLADAPYGVNPKQTLLRNKLIKELEIIEDIIRI